MRFWCARSASSLDRSGCITRTSRPKRSGLSRRAHGSASWCVAQGELAVIMHATTPRRSHAPVDAHAVRRLGRFAAFPRQTDLGAARERAVRAVVDVADVLAVLKLCALQVARACWRTGRGSGSRHQ